MNIEPDHAFFFTKPGRQARCMNLQCGWAGNAPSQAERRRLQTRTIPENEWNHKWDVAWSHAFLLGMFHQHHRGWFSQLMSEESTMQANRASMTVHPRHHPDYIPVQCPECGKEEALEIDSEDFDFYEKVSLECQSCKNGWDIKHDLYDPSEATA